jgi:coatomer subunit gamma
MSYQSKKNDGIYKPDKSTVMQEARVFNESPISPRKCRIVLTNILSLLGVGESFGTQEATTLFFGTTKLFQHKDVWCLICVHRKQPVDLTATIP